MASFDQLYREHVQKQLSRQSPPASPLLAQV